MNASPRGHTAFETALGTCAIAWSPAGIVAVQLPESTPERTVARIAERAGSADAAPPDWIAAAARRIAAALAGSPEDLSDLPLDLSDAPPFHAAVYAHVARDVPHGRTSTYGAVARAIGREGASRAVGQAMARNPVPVIVPCHRVLSAGGALTGFSAYGGLVTKARMLAREGVHPRVPDAPTPVPLSDPRFDAREARRYLTAKDPRLGAWMELVGDFGLAVEPREVYEAVARAIVYQQLTGKAAATIFGRVQALGGEGFPSPEAMLALPDEALRGAGLSGAKAASLKDLAAHAARGEIPTRAEALAMDDEALIERLTAVRGVGRWTVEMLLIFNLGRPDVFSAGDYGLKKGIARVDGSRAMPSPAAMVRRAARWAPWRSVASWYLWRICELPDDAGR